MKWQSIFITFLLLTSCCTRNIETVEREIVFAYIPPSIHQCFIVIQEMLEDHFIIENNNKDFFYDVCNLLEYDSKIASYRATFLAINDALDILEKSQNLFDNKKEASLSYQATIDLLQDYKESLLNNESIITVSPAGIKISQGLKNRKNNSCIIDLSSQDITKLLTLFKQKLYRSPRELSNEQSLPPTDSDFLDALCINSKSISTQNLNVCDEANINGTLNVCGEILLNSLDLEMEIENLISCCDNHESRLDVIDSEIDFLESCCDAQDSRLDILDSEVDLLNSCCDAQDSRIDVIDSEIDLLESCCDAQDSRLDLLESEVDLLNSCCDAQDSQIDVIDSEIDLLESCCDAQDSRLDLLESEVYLLNSCCDTQDSRIDVIDSEIDLLESCCDAQDSRVDVIDLRLDVIDSEIDLLESCCDAQDSRVDVIDSRLDVIDSEIDLLESCCDAQDSRLDILESEVDLLNSCCDAQDSRID
ncbi:MAG: hypothetical protein WCD44_04160, partial [Candidatus Babeliales bacterium]